MILLDEVPVGLGKSRSPFKDSSFKLIGEVEILIAIEIEGTGAIQRPEYDCSRIRHG